jgi:hypothetical protein
MAQLAAVFVLEVLKFMTLTVLKGDPRDTFEVAQQQEAAFLLWRIHANGSGAGLGKLFIGLCFIPFGMLVSKSGYAPKVIGILLIIGGVGYVADCFLSVLLQRSDYIAVRTYLMSTVVAYFLALLWFLIKGVQIPGNTTS